MSTREIALPSGHRSPRIPVAHFSAGIVPGVPSRAPRGQQMPSWPGVTDDSMGPKAYLPLANEFLGAP